MFAIIFEITLKAVTLQANELTNILYLVKKI